MKKLTLNSSRFIPALAAIAAGLLAINARAANQYYTTAVTDGGSYSWDDAVWGSAAAGPFTSVWASSNFARFAGTGSYTVTVNNTETNAGWFYTANAGTSTLTINAANGGNLYVLPASATGGGLTAGLQAQGVFIAGGGTLVINAPITGTGALSPTYSGTQYPTICLYGNNTYSGGTVLGSSFVLYQYNNNNSLGTGPININGTTMALFLSIGGAPITLANNWTNVSGGGIDFGNAVNTPVTCTGPMTLKGNLILKNNGYSTDSGGALTWQGVINGAFSLTLQGNNGGTTYLQGANTYSGQTFIQGTSAGGIKLSVSSLNKVSGGTASSSLGHPTSATTGVISIGSGTFPATLIYTGTGETTDRGIDLAGTTGASVLQNDGSGAITFSTNLITASGAGSKTFTLQGNNTGANTLAGKIVDNSAANTTAVAKNGTGKWVLAGVNAYTGGTTVTQGTLEISGSVVGSVTNTSGVLTLDNASALTNTATLALSSGTTVNLNFTGTNAINALVIDNGIQTSGVWGPVGSTAPHQSAIFQGTGFVNVLGKPVIVQQPISTSAQVGSSASFSVVVADPTGITYQWKQNGVNIPGANSDTLYISPVQANSAGAYTCGVTNTAGGTISAPANLFIPTTTAYTTAILGDGPVSYWRLDETNGSLAYDLMGSANGIYVGGVTLNQPGFSTTDTDPAVALNASVAYSGVQVTNVNNFKFNVSTPFTLEGWVYFNQAPGGTERLLSAMGGWGFGVADDHTLEFTLGGKADLKAPQSVSPAMQAGVWYYLAVTFDPSIGTAGQYAFYFNGQPLGTVAGQTYTGGASSLYLGCNPPAFPFSEGLDGRIDEVAAYTYNLTDAQIANHFAARYADAPPVPSLPVVNPATNYVSLTTRLQENAAGANLSYQWFKVPSTPVGQNSSVLTLSPLSLSDAGSYYVRISNGSITTNSPTNYVAVVPIPTSSTDTNLRSLTNGLVLHLPFDNDYKDISGRGNNGTAQGAPSFVAGQVGGNALHYSTASGSTNYVTLGVRPDLKFGTNNFSVAFWVRQPASSIYTNLPFFGHALGSTDGITNLHTGFCFAPYQADATDGGGWMEGISDGTHAMTSPSQYTVFSDLNLINDGQWHHLVHVADRAGSFTTYLDGQPFDAEAISFVTGSISNANAAVIGQDPTGAYPVTAQADMDDLGVWTRKLTAFEVSGIYLAGHANTPGVSFAPVISVAAPVTITGISGTTLSYSGGAGSTFTLLSSPNVNAPIGSWTVVGTSSATPGTFTIPAVGSSPTMFYRIKSQ